MPDLASATTGEGVPAVIAEVLPDYSQWLTDARLEVEEMLWSERRDEEQVPRARHLEMFCRKTQSTCVLEFGCGTGWVPAALPEWVRYMGIDANPGCIELARQKNDSARVFEVGDLRTANPPEADVVCSFSLMKHFGLHEWEAVLQRKLSFGNYGLFTVLLADADRDDGTEFHHTWVTEATLRAAIRAAGHELGRHLELWRGEQGAEWLVWTARR